MRINFYRYLSYSSIPGFHIEIRRVPRNYAKYDSKQNIKQWELRISCFLVKFSVFYHCIDMIESIQERIQIKTIKFIELFEEDTKFLTYFTSFVGFNFPTCYLTKMVTSCMCVNVWVCVCECVYVCVCVYVCECLCVCMCKCVCVCECVCIIFNYLIS